MRTLVTWCMILGMGVGGLVVSDALSWERWVNSSWVAAPRALAQERQPATSPVLRSRFARPAPRGWTAPSLVGVRDRPDEPWRSRLAQLGLPVTAQAPRLWVEPVGDAVSSMGRDARAPLPQVRLVKDVLEAMPDKCNEKLLGTWYCGIHCYRGDCDAMGGEETLRLSVDPDGYERIHRRLILPDERVYQSEYRVERQWGSAIGNHPLETGKLVAVSCNGKTDAGYSTLSVNLKNPDGSDRDLFIYWVDRANQTMWVEIYDVRWEGDTMYKKLFERKECRRELAP